MDRLDVGIGIWGGVGSGKSTFIAALKAAALLDPTGHWRITGRDKDGFPRSTETLLASERTLRRGDFPSATEADMPGDLSYEVSGHLGDSAMRRIGRMLGAERAREVSFTITFRDYKGGVFAETLDPDAPIWQHLAACQGLIYLYDPTHDGIAADGQPVGSSSMDYVELTADFLWQNTPPAQKADNYLPHYLAVCISKYDDPGIYEQLDLSHLIDYDKTSGAPLVSDPKRAFCSMANMMTVRTIERFFHPARTRYFATSSLGFNVSREGKFDPRDPFKVYVGADGKPRIRDGGNINPVNVFQPLLWIENEIYRSSGGR